MKDMKISSGGGTQFHSRPVPFHALYGHINGRDYICQSFNETENGFPIFVYDSKREVWKARVSGQFPAIHVVIAKHVKSGADLKVGAMPTKTRDKRAAFYSRKKREFQEMRQKREERLKLRQFAEAACGQRLANNEYLHRCKPVNAQAGIEDDRNFEYNGVGYDVIDRNMGDVFEMPMFDTGTNEAIYSVSDIEGEIFAPNKDRVKFSLNDFHGDKKPDYMKYRGKVTKKYEFKLYGA